MGRRKGSLNKKHKNPVILLKKKRGRPKQIVVPVEVEPLPEVKKVKFLGYCPKCRAMICKTDLKSKFVFSCPSCGKRARKNTLKKDNGNDDRPKSKKEYLEAAIETHHIDAPSFHEADISPKDLKVKED